MRGVILTPVRYFYRRLPPFIKRPVSAALHKLRYARASRRGSQLSGAAIATSIAAKPETNVIRDLRKSLVDQGKNLEASRRCETYLAVNPADADVWLFLASLYFALAQPKQAVGAILKVSELSRDPVTLLKAGRMMINLCGVRDILDVTCIEGMQEPVIALADEICAVCDPFALAERCFELVGKNGAARGPLTCATHVLWGALLYSKKEFGGAEAHFLIARNDFPPEAWSYIYLSEIYKKRGEYAAAIGVLEDIRTREPANMMVKLRLLQLQVLTGNIEDAAETAVTFMSTPIYRRLDEMG